MGFSISNNLPESCDVLVIGAGAAGLMAAIAARNALDGRGGRAEPDGPSVVVVNNEARIGLKILVSGGGRCNVTNETVDQRDYITDTPHLLKGLLRAFSVASTRAFFEQRGCPLYAEPMGKLFPQSDKARDILDVLLNELTRASVKLVAPAAADSLVFDDEWHATFSDGRQCKPKRVILATGGKSLPGTGSHGWGFDVLSKLGHTIEPLLPALTPVLLDEEGALQNLAGLTVPVVLSLVPGGTNHEQAAGAKFRPIARAGGSLLVTHQGISGPAALDVSGAVASALDASMPVRLSADFWSLLQPDSPWAKYADQAKMPGASLPANAVPRPPTLEIFREQSRELTSNPEISVGRAFGALMPRKLLDSLLEHGGISPSRLLRQLDLPAWKRVHLALTQCDLGATGVDGFNKAEVTVGGVRLDDLERNTLQSKRCPGLYVCGEVVNVTGRLGGFNFQWAWASGFAAGRAARESLE